MLLVVHLHDPHSVPSLPKWYVVTTLQKWSLNDLSHCHPGTFVPLFYEVHKLVQLKSLQRIPFLSFWKKIIYNYQNWIHYKIHISIPNSFGSWLTIFCNLKFGCIPYASYIETPASFKVKRNSCKPAACEAHSNGWKSAGKKRMNIMDERWTSRTLIM